jgi:hypothetical protein
MLLLSIFRIAVALFFVFLLAGFFRRGLKIVRWWQDNPGVSWGLSFAIVLFGWFLLARLAGRVPSPYKFLFTVSIAAYLFLELVYFMNRSRDDAAGPGGD